MTPQSRQWLYIASLLASAVVPLLVGYKVIGTDVSGAWLNLIGVLGALSTGGAATAAVVLARQRKEGTLDFTGSPPEQAVAALQATIDRASTAASDLDKVKEAVNQVLNATPELAPVADPAPAVTPGSLVEQLLNAVKPAE